MSTSSEPGTVRVVDADLVSRPAFLGHAPVVPLPVPAPRDSTETPGPAEPDVPGLAGLLTAVRAASEGLSASGAATGTRPIPRRVSTSHVTRRDEFAAQDLALAGESADLRARAGRYAAIIESGAAVGTEEVESVLRAFRSYEPFLGVRDRTLNTAAYRRLAGARGGAQVA